MAEEIKLILAITFNSIGLILILSLPVIIHSKWFWEVGNAKHNTNNTANNSNN